VLKFALFLAGRFEKMKRKRNYIFWSCATVLLSTAISNAAILQVSDIQITCPGVFFTYTSGTGTLNLNKSVIGLLKLQGSSTYDFSISSAVLSFTDALIQDTSSGGYARGLFAGGRTMSLTGTIKYTSTGTTVYSGTIFSALMTIDSTGTWVLAESPSSAINGNVEFNTDTNIGLGSGISFGSDILKFGSFRGDFAFKGLQPNPSRFAVTQNLIGTASTLQLTAIPEPASIIMFVAAIATLRLKKNKNLINYTLEE
jgi:hypothetical protein